MPTTTYGLSYPAGTDSPDVPRDMADLAQDVNAQLYKFFTCTSTTRPALVTGDVGFAIRESDTGAKLVWSGTTWEAIGSGGGGGGGVTGGPIGASAFYSATAVQNIPNQTDTPVAFEVDQTLSSMVTKAPRGAGHQFTLNRTSQWIISTTVRFEQNAVGGRTIEIRTDGGVVLAKMGNPMGGDFAEYTGTITATRELTTGTIVYVNVRHNASTSLPLEPNLGAYVHIDLMCVSGIIEGAGGVASDDPRLTDQRAPLDASVTDAKVAAGAAVSLDKTADSATRLAMTAAERTKLTGVATGATANATDAQLRDRSTHTGTQSADTLTDGTTNKAFLATERTKLAGIATGATAYTSENARDDLGTALVAGANVTITPSDVGDTITIAAATTGASGVPGTIIDAKGDLIAGTAADTPARVAVGTDAQVLTASSAAGTGLAWAANVPSDGSVTDAKVSGSAAIDADKIADGTINKVYTATEKTKLAGIASGATQNATDAQLRDRATHTGTQSADTITDGSTNKAYTATEKTKLAAIGVVRTVNPSAGSISVDANTAGNNIDSTLSADATLNVPTNGAAGQVLQGSVLASAAQRVLTFSGSFARLTGIAATLTIPSGKVGRYALRRTDVTGSARWIVEAAGVEQ